MKKATKKVGVAGKKVTKNYQGKQFTATIGGETRGEVEAIIDELQEASFDSGIGEFEVLDIRPDPDGGWEATIRAHNFNWASIGRAARKVGGWARRGIKRAAPVAGRAIKATAKAGGKAAAATGRFAERRIVAQEEISKVRAAHPAPERKRTPSGRYISKKRIPRKQEEEYYEEPIRREPPEMVPAGRAIWPAKDGNGFRRLRRLTGGTE